MHIYMQLHLSQKLPEAGNERLSRQRVWLELLTGCGLVGFGHVSATC
jgi:hypothetical protein